MLLGRYADVIAFELLFVTYFRCTSVTWPVNTYYRSQKGRQLSSHSLAELRTMVVDAREAARKTIKAAATAYPAPYK